MKILKDGSKAFYAKKNSSFSGLVFFIIICAILVGLFLLTNSAILILLSIGAGLISLYLLYGMFISKPLVTIGNDYLLLCGHKVLFREIGNLYRYKYATLEMIEVKVKDESKYAPTSMQKFALQLGHPLFFIAIGSMDPTEAAELEAALSNILPLEQGENR